MRIWHESLIPKLCRQHLLACWRESLGCYAIVTGKVNGGSYRNHPAVKEFENCPLQLWYVLGRIEDEMHRRGYHPKQRPFPCLRNDFHIPWQSLEEQTKILQNKGCQCRV